MSHLILGNLRQESTAFHSQSICTWTVTYGTHISPFADDIVDITEPGGQTHNTLIDGSATVLLCELIFGNWNPAEWPYGKPNRIAAGYICWQDFILLAGTVVRQLCSAASNSSISLTRREVRDHKPPSTLCQFFHCVRQVVASYSTDVSPIWQWWRILQSCPGSRWWSDHHQNRTPFYIRPHTPF